MPLFIDPEKCPQNHKCPLVAECPMGAISQEGFNLPVINNQECILCRKCVRLCGMQAVYETK